jgi:hypothetical protein
MMGLYNVDMRNMIIFNTMNELVGFLSSADSATLVNVAAFGMDLLDLARSNGNEIEIGEDGGFVRIDEMGYVVEEFAIDNVRG